MLWGDLGFGISDLRLEDTSSVLLLAREPIVYGRALGLSEIAGAFGL